jgi:hypothetical protein
MKETRAETARRYRQREEKIRALTREVRDVDTRQQLFNIAAQA